MNIHAVRQFRKDAVNAHNDLRRKHGCPPLIWKEDLIKSAQIWAENLAERGFVQYSEESANAVIGENISVVDLNGHNIEGKQIVEDWYSEIKNYNFNKPGWRKDTCHFSQLLWRSSSDIGVGIAQVPNQNRVFIVVHYRPVGNTNMPGDFKKNVLPVLESLPDNRKALIVGHKLRSDRRNVGKLQQTVNASG
ncbi:Uncharacterised protein g721 [Pycnogonum litorale]